METLFEPYRSIIGKDYDGYRNHVYRTITYAMHFLNQSPELEPLVETAFVYHDIGLWTDRALAYLEPSEAVALEDNQKYGWGLDPDALRGAIHWHHKLFRYRGDHQELIEACRKADWIDATQGWIRKGLSRSSIAKVESAFPNCGFHQSLMRLAREYGGSTIVGGYESQIKELKQQVQSLSEQVQSLTERLKKPNPRNSSLPLIEDHAAAT